MRKVAITAFFFLFFCLVAFSGAVVHECGHAVTALAFGCKVQAIGSAPGIVLYPELGFYRWKAREDPIAWCIFDHPEVAWKSGLCYLMGSGATTLVGYLVLVAILIFRPSRWKWVALAIIVVVYTTDLPMYAIFPKLGLRAVPFIGGSKPYPEPLIGVMRMGLPEGVFFTLVAIDILLVSGLLLYSVLRLRTNNKGGKDAVLRRSSVSGLD